MPTKRKTCGKREAKREEKRESEWEKFPGQNGLTAFSL